MSRIENSKSLHYLSASASASAPGIKTSFALYSPSEASSEAHQKMYCPWKSIDLQWATSFTPRVFFNNCSICYFSSLFGDRDGVALLQNFSFFMTYSISIFPKYSDLKKYFFSKFLIDRFFSGNLIRHVSMCPID